MQLYTSIVTCVVFISLVGNAFAIDCWVCTSADAGCGESINEETLQDNLKTASGCMGCSKTFKSLGTIWSEVQRMCLTTATDTCDNKLGYGECTCSTTFCNGENKLSIKPLTVLMISVFCMMFYL
ncbi:uncharacterized protein LOC134707121 [Mytilus trossulus]|uniref:uncharacterized protein LOC134707121 n=1 Tax=Mytilus trossulus TaxID=6551 RepID=UPI003003F4F1